MPPRLDLGSVSLPSDEALDDSVEDAEADGGLDGAEASEMGELDDEAFDKQRELIINQLKENWWCRKEG